MCISRFLYEMVTLVQGNEQDKEVFLLRRSKEVPGPIVQEVGWVPGPVWTRAENLAPTWIRSPDRPARSQSLYRLRYPAHTQIYIYIYIYSQNLYTYISNNQIRARNIKYYDCVFVLSRIIQTK